MNVDGKKEEEVFSTADAGRRRPEDESYSLKIQHHLNEITKLKTKYDPLNHCTTLILVEYMSHALNLSCTKASLDDDQPSNEEDKLLTLYKEALQKISSLESDVDRLSQAAKAWKIKHQQATQQLAPYLQYRDPVEAVDGDTNGDVNDDDSKLAEDERHRTPQDRANANTAETNPISSPETIGSHNLDQTNAGNEKKSDDGNDNDEQQSHMVGFEESDYSNSDYPLMSNHISFNRAIDEYEPIVFDFEQTPAWNRGANFQENKEERDVYDGVQTDWEDENDSDVVGRHEYDDDDDDDEEDEDEFRLLCLQWAHLRERCEYLEDQYGMMRARKNRTIKEQQLEIERLREKLRSTCAECDALLQQQCSQYTDVD